MELKYKLRTVTPPSVEPITLAEALEHCHANSGVEDNWFYRNIKSARIAAENYHGRSYIQQTLEVTYDYLPSTPINLPRSPAISVDSVTVYDQLNAANAVTLTDFLIDTQNEPASIVFNDGYDWDTSIITRETAALKIQFKAGYGTTAATVPDHAKSAMLIYLSWLYEYRAGEQPLPEAFYNLLRQDRMHPYET